MTIRVEHALHSLLCWAQCTTGTGGVSTSKCGSQGEKTPGRTSKCCIRCGGWQHTTDRSCRLDGGCDETAGLPPSTVGLVENAGARLSQQIEALERQLQWITTLYGKDVTRLEQQMGALEQQLQRGTIAAE